MMGESKAYVIEVRSGLACSGPDFTEAAMLYSGRVGCAYALVER